MDTLFDIHSFMRWVVVLAAAVVVLRLALGVLRREKHYSRESQTLLTMFTTVVDIQFTLGLIYLVWSGLDHDFWPRYRFEHAITIFIASLVLHSAMRWRKAPAQTRYRSELITVLVAVLLIIVAVARLPQIDDTNRWFYAFLRMLP